jgi:hypothetical protein
MPSIAPSTPRLFNFNGTFQGQLGLSEGRQGAIASALKSTGSGTLFALR